MVACSIGEVIVLTGVIGLLVDGVYASLEALSVDCSIGSRPLIDVRALRRNCAVTVTMARDYQSASGYGGWCTGGMDQWGEQILEIQKQKTKAFNRKDRKELPQSSRRKPLNLEKPKSAICKSLEGVALLCALCETLATFAVKSFWS